MARSPYLTLYARLVANTHEPENDRACWHWAGKRGGGSYGRVNLYVPGLARVVTLQANILLWVCLHAEVDGADDAYLAYVELQASGLELDHLCYQTSCCNPDHQDPVTPRENCQRRRNFRL